MAIAFSSSSFSAAEGSAGVDGNIAAGLNDAVKGRAVHHEVAHDRERPCPPRLDSDRLAVLEVAHGLGEIAGAAVDQAEVVQGVGARPLLADAGIIAAAERTAKLTRWERAAGRGHHDHMRCARCGKAIEFYSAELERLQERLCRAHRFTSLRHTLQIHGICRTCARTARAARRRGGAAAAGPPAV